MKLNLLGGEDMPKHSGGKVGKAGEKLSNPKSTKVLKEHQDKKH